MNLHKKFVRVSVQTRTHSYTFRNAQTHTRAAFLREFTKESGYRQVIDLKSLN